MQETPKFKLDHFIAYEIVQPIGFIDSTDQILKIEDQFGSFEARIYSNPFPDYFANPVNKNGEGIINASAHLTWYRLFGISNPPRKVFYKNQMTDFSLENLETSSARFLLVPTHKREEGQQFPDSLSHFVCYQVEDNNAHTKEVELKDQFTSQTAIASGPYLFCTPSSKNGEPIFNSEDHLTVYKIGPNPTERNVTIFNQFGETRFTTVGSSYLCVPTKKDSFVELSKTDNENSK